MAPPEVVLGPYRITALLGEGGMGRVYRAVHGPLDREVALKLLYGDALESEDAKVRFHREMRLAATLSHPNVVKIYDGGVIDAFEFLAMELVPGVTVNHAVAALERVPWPWTLALGAQLADALAHLHAHGIVHRDVKHNNVKLTPDGQLKLLDFGLARALDSTALTGADVWVGTFRYVAPEVLTGEPATAASDLWSLGVMLYELSTGRPFLEGRSLQGFVQSLIHEDLVPLGERVPGIPTAVSGAVMRLLEKDVSRRASSAADVAASLADLLARLDGRTPESALRHGFGPRPPGSGEVPAPVVEAPSPPPLPPAPLPIAGPTLPRRGARRRAPTRRGLTLAALTSGALAALCVLAVAPRAAPRPVPREPPASSAPAPSAWQAPAFVPYTDRWREVAALAPRLRAGGEQAADALADCRTRCGLDLGPEARTWLAWVELGRWLESPGRTRPPVLRAGTRPPDSATEESLMLIFVGLHDADSSPSLTEAALKMTLVWTEDARGWLLLGHALEHDRRPEAARRAYGVALARLEDSDVHSAPMLLWNALGRAALLASPRGPAAEWLYWLRRATNQNKAWRSLRSALQRSDPAVYEAVLRAATEDPKLAESAYHYLGRHLLDHRRDPRAAIAALTEGVRRMPGSGDLVDLVVWFHLQRGDLAGAAGLLATPFARDRWQDSLARLRDDRADPGSCDPHAPAAEWRQKIRIALAYLDRGCLTAAEQLAHGLERRDEDDREERTALVLELFGRGSKADWVRRAARELLLGSKPNWDVWATATGALAAGPAAAGMEGFLTEAATRWPTSWKPPLARALWLARQGRHADALTALDAVPSRRDAVPRGPRTEILARTIWAAAAGDEGARAALPAVLAREPPDAPGTPRALYWAQLTEGNLAAAADLAVNEFLLDPEEPLWTLAIARFAALPAAPEAYRGWPRRLKLAARVSVANPWLARELAR